MAEKIYLAIDITGGILVSTRGFKDENKRDEILDEWARKAGCKSLGEYLDRREEGLDAVKNHEFYSEDLEVEE